MPVAIKLSKRFYDRFGDDIVTEFVGLLNQVDASSRSDLRELSENSIARFEARLDQRVAQLEARMESVETRLTARTETLFATYTATIKDDLAKRFSEQTRFLYLGWALQFAAILGLFFR